MSVSARELRKGDLENIVIARFEESIRLPEVFFASEAGRISQACRAMAARFRRGGRIFAFGNGGWATDANHVSVEFVHPVIVGKRALPALTLTKDSGSPAGRGSDSLRVQTTFRHQIEILAHPEDIALGFSPDGNCENVLSALQAAQGLGMLTLGFTGGDGGALARVDLDYCFVVPEVDPFVIQETHETLYHILWELVHVFFDHEAVFDSVVNRQ